MSECATHARFDMPVRFELSNRLHPPSPMRCGRHATYFTPRPRLELALDTQTRSRLEVQHIIIYRMVTEVFIYHSVCADSSCQ